MGYRSLEFDGRHARGAGLISVEIVLVQHKRILQGGAQRIEGLSNSSTNFYALWAAEPQRERIHDCNRMDLNPICRNEEPFSSICITPGSPPAVKHLCAGDEQ
jgi:hypothetical protein